MWGMSNKVEVEGILRVYDRDKSGNVLQLFLETDSFEKYVIESPFVEELHELINLRFKLFGIVTTFGNGSYKIISVDHYVKITEQNHYGN